MFIILQSISNIWYYEDSYGLKRKYLPETQKTCSSSGGIILKTREREAALALLYSHSHLFYLTKGPKLSNKLTIDWNCEPKCILISLKLFF